MAYYVRYLGDLVNIFVCVFIKWTVVTGERVCNNCWREKGVNRPGKANDKQGFVIYISEC